MKAWKRVLCVILALLILAVGGVTIWQWNNVKPWLMGRLFSEETLGQRMEDLLDEQQKKLEEKGVTAEGLTKEQIGQMLRGELDEETAKETLRKKQNPKADATKPEALLNECVARLYEYESQMYAQLSAIYQSAESRWKSTPKAQRTRALKNEIKSESINRCYSMEVEADNLVSATLDEYRAKVTAAGGSAADVDALWNVYSAKKASVKAYYYNLIKDKGEKKA